MIMVGGGTACMELSRNFYANKLTSFISLWICIESVVIVLSCVSWSPRGVLLAAHNQAKYIKDGKVKQNPRKCLAGKSVGPCVCMCCS